MPDETSKAKLKFTLPPESVWVSSPELAARLECHDGEVIEVEVDAEGKPVDENFKGVIELGFGVIEG